ncbi:mRNA turnover protein 4 homolog [Neodiprion pinetum]|uniref:Ribosome assembly factor mrt4 n=1 Tax=Neodiprion lecontei TaxID=441921 RepID=A0A6J0BDW1_NEOLC|nr:mRNA turnover protein 4 homolog [Neodiprion lecontei]XP_046413599.1 mRNA turnover protein 4 homolog [Neodiprion fabricii]XP_046469375.1 mRNA turnover protein 4 homolog [Neodiprion pinetum]XP_046606997.1 mRNA turnover protein 4 homolog [Neodiprion virginianus]
MPKSKRDKKITLTKTSKKGLVLKQQIVEDIRKCVTKYNSIFLFSVQNMRNNKLKDIRAEWKDSRFFFGKNKIMALGLGKSPEEEVEDEIHKLSAALKGQCGLLFTNRPKDEVLDWMEQYGEEDYARSGFVANETITIPEGPMPEFAHSIEPHLRQLGLPTSLQKGVVTLLKDHEVCKKGQTLTPEQARILKLIGKVLATFKLTPLGVFVKSEGYMPIATDDNDDNEDDNVEMETEDTTDT